MSEEKFDQQTLLLLALWPKLKPNAQRSLLHVIHQLITDYTGNIKWKCNKGGIRKVFLEQEFDPNTPVEVVLGEEEEPK